MNKTKFDLMVENILNITEGRKPKTYAKMVIDYDKLEQDINNLSDSNPFKKIYLHALNGLKEYGEGKYFTNQEMSAEAKTLPELEESLYNAFSGAALSKVEKKTFAERFFKFITDPDREYMSEHVAEVSADKHVESVSQHIYDYINQSDDETASIEEVIAYIGRYGHDEAEVKEIIQKMVEDGQLAEVDGKLTAIKDPSLDELEPSDSELGVSNDPDDLEAFRDDTLEDEEPDSGRLPDDVAKELGINADDPFGDSDFLASGEKYED